MRACSGATAAAISASVKRGVMCCGQFQSNASTAMTQAPLDLGRDSPRQLSRSSGGRILGRRDRPRAAEDLQPAAARVVDQDQRHPVVAGQIADADILPVAAKVREADRPLVQHLEEARRPAAMLDVGPAGLADRRHVEAVARGEEGCLGGTEPSWCASPPSKRA